jgi:hypothetical protein
VDNRGVPVDDVGARPRGERRVRRGYAKDAEKRQKNTRRNSFLVFLCALCVTSASSAFTYRARDHSSTETKKPPEGGFTKREEEKA